MMWLIGVVKGLGPAKLFGLAKFAVVAGIISAALVMAGNFMADQREIRDSLIEANAEKVSQQAKAQELANANVQLQSALDVQKESARQAARAI